MRLYCNAQCRTKNETRRITAFDMASVSPGTFERAMKKTIKKTKTAKQSLTDRSRAEPSLENSELRYRRLFETAQDGILILDAKIGAIKDVTPYLIPMLGYSRTEFIEKKLWQVGAMVLIVAYFDVNSH